MLILAGVFIGLGFATSLALVLLGVASATGAKWKQGFARWFGTRRLPGLARMGRSSTRGVTNGIARTAATRLVSH